MESLVYRPLVLDLKTVHEIEGLPARKHKAVAAPDPQLDLGSVATWPTKYGPLLPASLPNVSCSDTVDVPLNTGGGAVWMG